MLESESQRRSGWILPDYNDNLKCAEKHQTHENVSNILLNQTHWHIYTHSCDSTVIIIMISFIFFFLGKIFFLFINSFCWRVQGYNPPRIKKQNNTTMALIGWREYSQQLLFIAQKSLNELQNIFHHRVWGGVCVNSTLRLLPRQKWDFTFSWVLGNWLSLNNKSKLVYYEPPLPSRHHQMAHG